MEPSRTALAHAIDALAATGRVTVTESRTEIAIYQLDAAGVRLVAPLVAPAGFVVSVLADEGGTLDLADVADGSEGIELVATKPAVPDGILPILTRAGFRTMLDRVPDEPVVWLEELDRRIDTVCTRYSLWGDLDPFDAEEAPANPARVVRILGIGGAPDPIGRWLLRDPDVNVSGPVLSPWRIKAAGALAASLSQEVESDGRLLFRGPPPTRFRREGGDRIEVNSFSALQAATAWVYENPRELENRHGLLGAEVARTALRAGNLADLASVMPMALEGARIAFGFGVSQQSRDALKTLSDLRKAVSDETGKLADTTRTLATAMTTSALANAGLVIARLTLPKGAEFIGPAAFIIGVALALYVAVVIATGFHFISIQRDLRENWRDRLYRFLPEAEYELMVTKPVGRAETGFRNTAIASGLLAIIMLVAVAWVVSTAETPPVGP
jgi:hypothetical protein